MSDPIDDLSALRIEREPLTTGGRRWGRWVALLVLLAATGGGAYWWTTPRGAARGRGGRR